MRVDIPAEWPAVFELNVGESVDLAVRGELHRVILRSVVHISEPDHWILDNPEHRTYCAAQVTVEIDGGEFVLLHRPYQMPAEIGPLRLYVETTRPWATQARIEVLDGMERDVRFSVRPAGAAWGPVSLRFPIRDYRWRSASYNNTWSALVPYNLLYYHRGDDFGAIPDRLPVVALLDGVVTSSPVPNASGSNGVSVQTASGLTYRYAHMNIETIDPALTPGVTVAAGQVLGRTGCTWNGYRSQWADPHLHVELALGPTTVSSYPFLVEAYLRDYPDPLLPVAGGYVFGQLGNELCLDGSRTIARAGTSLARLRWRLHDGAWVEGAKICLRYDRPGQYAEELVVTTSQGEEARDFAHVRIYDPDAGRDFAYGWAYASPVREVAPGTPVLFWNRLINTVGPVSIDFGDGSSPGVITDDAVYSYRAPGHYTVTLTGGDRCGQTAVAKLSLEVV